MNDFAWIVIAVLALYGAVVLLGELLLAVGRLIRPLLISDEPAEDDPWRERRLQDERCQGDRRP